MEAEQPQSEIDRILTTLEALEQQREVVGDAINPAVEAAKQQLQNLLPTEPTDEQIETAEKWQTFVEMSESLGLPTPEPTEAILDATGAIDAYKAVQQKIGIIGVTASTEVVDAPAAPAAKPKKPKAAKPKATTPPKEDTAPKPDAPESGEVILSVGDKEYKLLPINRDMNLRLLKALADAPEGINTSDFAREVSGGVTSTEIRLARKGMIELPENVVLEDAKRIVDQFYSVLKKNKERGIIEHESGSDSYKSGHMRLAGPIQFIEEDGVTRILASRRPYKVLLNLYDHSIENGRGKRVEIGKEDEAFLRISQALGAIALKTPEEHKRITRSDITSWIDEEHGSDISAHPRSQAKLADDLREVVNAFNEEFPLSTHGKSGGSHYKWESSASVETVDRWPEKPNFEDAVRVSISSTGIVASLDGAEKVLLSHDSKRFQTLINANDFALDKTIANYEEFFQMLSCLESHTKISLEDGMDMMLGDNVDKDDRAAAVNRFRIIVKKLNSLFGEDIVNWQNHTGVVLDINRRIIVETNGDGDSDGDSSDPETKASASDNGKGTLPDSDTTLNPEDNNDGLAVGAQGDVLDTGIDPDAIKEVGPAKTAKEIIEAANNLDEKTKVGIRGLLVQNGRFEYPKRIEEAVYLLQLVLDDSVGAEIREHSRFYRDGYKGFKILCTKWYLPVISGLCPGVISVILFKRSNYRVTEAVI